MRAHLSRLHSNTGMPLPPVSVDCAFTPALVLVSCTSNYVDVSAEFKFSSISTHMRFTAQHA